MLARSATLAIVLACVTGCLQTMRNTDLHGEGKQADRLPPTLARLQRTYPDLHTGRFLCLADCNTRPQAALFRTLDADGAEIDEQPTISVRHSIDETGAGGLKAHLRNVDDRLLFDGARSDKLALVRDWRKYNLLLFSMYGPSGGLTMKFSVRSGSDVPIHWTRNLAIKPGWHLYRFDLAEIGERVDLADVRALVWRAPELHAPLDVFLDDVLLTDNTRYLLGEEAAEGQLYIFTRGRRIHVGARGRFELAFCDGVIVEWHGDSRQNLAVRSGLGPWPVPLPEDWRHRQADPVVYDDPTLFATWGTRVAATQQLVEKSGLRVVIEGNWRFLPAAASRDSAEEDAPLPQHAWRYVIYPSGRVYVRNSSQGNGLTWPAQRVGYTIAVDGRSGFTRIAPGPSVAGSPATAFVLLSLPGRARPDLLWCPHVLAVARRQLELTSSDERRVAVTVGDVEPSDGVDAAHLLRFWPCDLDATPEGQTFAADYQHPATLSVARGRTVTNVPGDLDHDGFNESEGCYELALTEGLLRFKLLPGTTLRHQPVFRVHAATARDCWVYADGRILREQARDTAGNLLFTFPGVVGTPLTIEVNTRPRSAAR